MGFDFANPPPGVDLSESRTAANNAIGIVLFVLSAIFVGLRWLTRTRYQQAGLRMDDWLMLLGLVLNAGNLACCIAGGFFGLGKHIWSLDGYQMRKITIITFAYVFIYAWSVCIIKFSIIALYRRIFGMTWLGWWCVFLTTGYLITNHVVLPLYTRPLSYYWNQWEGAEGVVLVDEAKFYLGVGIINLFGDICILSVPIASVLKLQMSKPQKIAVCFMFLLGSFVCFASLYRIVTITRLGKTTDISWAKSDVFIWSSVEPSIGIISGCLPTLRPVMMRVLDAVFGYVPSSLSGSGGRSGGVSSRSRSMRLQTLETISKKRTRPMRRGDEILDSVMDNESDEYKQNTEDGSPGGGSRVRPVYHKRSSQSGAWRPDEDEMCLTTTVIQGKDSNSIGGDSAERGDSREQTGDIGQVVVTKEFAWGEGPRIH